MEAQGSQLTNKYAEGYPGKRYYGGCEYVDIAEQLAIDRAKALFGAEYANVQPHSGSQANQAVYAAVLKPGDTILGMSLAHGGHLTHGATVNISGKLYNAITYGLNEQEEIDYDQVRKLASEHKPKMIVAGAPEIGVFPHESMHPLRATTCTSPRRRLSFRQVGAKGNLPPGRAATHRPATVIPSTRIEPHCRDPCTRTSLPIAAMWRYMSFRFPAMVISSTGY